MKRLFSIILLLAVAACTKFDEPMPVQEDEPVEVTEELSGQTRAGNTPVYEKMANPYTLEVMQAVYDSLSIERVVLQPTDKYVRIKPQNFDQLDWLWDESGFELFDRPLDIRMEAGQRYVDPTISEGEFGWLYTTVKPNFTFPTGYVYEVLEDCYIPDKDEVIETSVGTRAGEETTSVNVEKAALERMGYVSASRSTNNKNTKGYIKIWDDTKSDWVGLKGVVISCHFFFFTVNSAWTDENGYYEMGISFSDDMEYIMTFTNIKDFKIWGDYTAVAPVAYSLGYHDNNGYNHSIGTNYPSWRFGVVNNAAYEYYEMCEDTGIVTPPEVLKISVIDNLNWSSAPMLREGVAGSEILSDSDLGFYLSINVSGIDLDTIMIIAAPHVIIGTMPNYTYGQIFEYVNHELSHASHFSQVCEDNTDYWAKYIRHIVDAYYANNSAIYGSTGRGPYAQICGIGEMWGYAMGHILEHEYYGDSIDVPYPYAKTPGSDGAWIKPEVIWDINRRGLLTKKEIFDCLTVDVDTYEKLMMRMSASNSYRAGEILDIFNTHGLITPFDLINTTVTSDYSKWAPYGIYVRGVSVSNGATLTIMGPSVAIDAPFTVDMDSNFEIRSLFIEI